MNAGLLQQDSRKSLESERAAYIEQLRAEYRQDIDIYKLASDLHD